MLTRSFSRGVTLIEISVALAVLAILMMAVMPGMGDWMRGLKVRNAAESIANGIQRARMEALRSNQEVSFWLVSAEGKVLTSNCRLDGASRSWVVSRDDPSDQCNVAESTAPTATPFIYEKYPSPDSGVTSTATDAGGTARTTVVFNGYGQVKQTGYTPIQKIDIRYGDDGSVRALRVQIGSGGQVRVCDPNVAVGDVRRCD